MDILRNMEASVVWCLDGAVFGLLLMLIYNIIITKTNGVNKK